MSKLPKVSMKVLEIIEQTMVKQNEKGVKKYGENLDEAKHSDYDWNVMVIEELVDGIQYVVKENMRLKELLEKERGYNTIDLNKVFGAIMRELKTVEHVREFEGSVIEYIVYLANERANTLRKIKKYNLSNLYPEKMVMKK